MTAVFLTYNGVLDPLGPSQMLPYLERLNREWPVHIISFERADKLAETAKVEAMAQRLGKQRLGWTRLRYHKRFSLASSTYDMLSGVVALRRLMARTRIKVLHARGYLPMEIAVNATPTRATPILFDIRGLQPEEYVDGGVWREGELKWRIAKRSERRFFRRASAAVVLTEAIKPYVLSRFRETREAPPVEVVPCCVELERFTFQPDERARRRAELGVSDDTVVFVYSGSIGTWYLSDLMAEYVHAFKVQTGRKVFLLWTTNNGADLARAASDRAGLAASEVSVISSTSAEMAGVLSAADVGLALIKPCFSKKSSSPTKYAEYLAVGLPIVINRDVGDGVVVEREDGAVAVGETLDAAAMKDAVARLVQLLEKPRAHFRAVAERLFDVDRVALPSYRRLYDQLVSS